MKKTIPFGKYQLLERVNVGGMAEVFMAKAFGAEGFERLLAIKKILPTMVEDDEFITMFLDEARISVQLNHPNVVQIHELGKQDEQFYIAMDYVAGKDLKTILERYRRRREIMPTAQAVYLAIQMSRGLDYAHKKKDARGLDLHIVHRDVSPQNILVGYDGTVKIIDFGIAKAANRAQKTQAGILKGKFGYMSPEQVRGLPIDRRSDIFALGVVLFEMLTGEKLFQGESDFSTLEKVRNAEVPSPRSFNGSIPAALEKVAYKALAREVEDRYQWAGELADDLVRFLGAGDTTYGTKHLGGFMSEAFADDISREKKRIAQFEGVAPPPALSPAEQVGPTVRGAKAFESNSGPQSRPAQGARVPTAAQLPATRPASPSTVRKASGQFSSQPGAAKAPVAGVSAPSAPPARKSPSRPQPAIDDPNNPYIPPPSAEELAEMDVTSDRTEMFRPMFPEQKPAVAPIAPPKARTASSSQLPAARSVEPSKMKPRLGLADVAEDSRPPQGHESETLDGPTLDPAGVPLVPEQGAPRRTRNEVPATPAVRAAPGRSAPTRGELPRSIPDLPPAVEPAEEVEEATNSFQARPSRPGPAAPMGQPALSVTGALELPEGEAPGDESQEPSQLDAPPAGGLRGPRLALVVAVGVALVGLLVVGIASRLRGPAMGSVRLSVRPALPAGARLTLDGVETESGRELAVAAGSHLAKLEIDGATAAEKQLELTAGAVEKVTFDVPKPEPKPEPAAEVKPEPKPEPVVEAKPEPKPEPVAEVKPEPKPEPVAEVKPEPTPEPKVEAVKPKSTTSAKVFTLTVVTDPPDALVYVNGKSKRGPSSSWPKLDKKKALKLRVEAKGYTPKDIAKFKPTNEDAQELEVVLVAKAAPAPKVAPPPKPAPAPKPVKAAPPPKPTPAPKVAPAKATKGEGLDIAPLDLDGLETENKGSAKPKKGAKPEKAAKPEASKAEATGKTGQLACGTENPGARVLIDGKDSGRVTPVLPSSPLELSAGKHTVTFVAKSGAKKAIIVVITAGQLSAEFGHAL